MACVLIAATSEPALGSDTPRHDTKSPEIEGFRKNNPDMWPKCSYLEELVEKNKKFN